MKCYDSKSDGLKKNYSEHRLYILAIPAAVLCIRLPGPGLSAVITFIWLCLLIGISDVDIREMKIPDRWTIVLALIGIVSCRVISGCTLTDRIKGMFIVSIPMLLTDFLFPAGFGGGDIKLMAAAGLFLGWRRNMLAFLAALLAAGSYSIFLLVTGKAGMKDHFAFGPFLCGGLALAALSADKLL